MGIAHRDDKPRIKITTTSIHPDNVRIYIVKPDGEEIDISRLVKGFVVTGKVAEITTAKLDAMVDISDILAELEK